MGLSICQQERSTIIRSLPEKKWSNATERKMETLKSLCPRQHSGGRHTGKGSLTLLNHRKRKQARMSFSSSEQGKKMSYKDRNISTRKRQKNLSEKKGRVSIGPFTQTVRKSDTLYWETARNHGKISITVLGL